MVRFFVRLMTFALAIAVSLYIGVQWKLKQDLKYLTSKIAPQIQFEYESSSLTPGGTIVITGIHLYIRAQDLKISIAKVEYSAGSIFDMAFLKGQIDDQKFPEKVSLAIDQLIVPLTPSLVKTIAVFEQGSTWNALNASACGAIKHFGVNEYFSMGYDYIVFSSQSEFHQDDYSGNLIGKGWYDIEETSKFSYELNLSNFYQAVNVSDDDFPTLESLSFDIEDNGYNHHKNEFCSLKLGVSASEYVDQHVKTVVKSLAGVGIQMTLASQRIYKNSMQPLSRLKLSIEPKPSFSFADFGYYNETELRDILRLKIAVNGENVGKIFNHWSLDKFDQVVVEGAIVEQSDLLKSRYENVIIKHFFEKVSLSLARNFMNYKIKIIRNDGKTYIGKLTEIKDNKLYVAMQIEQGIVEVSVEKNLITEFFVYR